MRAHVRGEKPGEPRTLVLHLCKAGGTVSRRWRGEWVSTEPPPQGATPARGAGRAAGPRHQAVSPLVKGLRFGGPLSARAPLTRGLPWQRKARDSPVAVRLSKARACPAGQGAGLRHPSALCSAPRPAGLPPADPLPVHTRPGPAPGVSQAPATPRPPALPPETRQPQITLLTHPPSGLEGTLPR